MKKYTIIYLLFSGLFLSSCTDVIEVDVPEVTPKLVIEASIDWEKETLGNNQTIKLSTTKPYFESTDNNTAVIGAIVKVINNTDGAEFIFVDQNNGNYTTSNFVPILNQSYTLDIMYNGENYQASETLISVVDINEVYQSIEDGFDDEVLEINVSFDDPVDEENFYLMKFKEQGDLLPELFDISDEFTNGNEMTIFYEKQEDEDINQEEFSAGDVVAVSFHGISEQYFNYIRLLIELSANDGDPFSSIPVALQGNCINLTNSENEAYGYFRLTQVVNQTYIFE
ncbi:DUF4249 domain-containing protein [Urechidicola croceus]|uniref:DUF4249 domain-containing protein n=1 Tax=Urechidicola croceus TaxID=1850246 RepID=A0A1D8P5K7_9FLAO|nr:DUF4249 domain-containing protein [Urechidicola croceus]AOW19872.1 hypothetical protein LPB138_03875 [Urechidicola croceus]